jgi:hypothetical protein
MSGPKEHYRLGPAGVAFVSLACSALMAAFAYLGGSWFLKAPATQGERAHHDSRHHHSKLVLTYTGL